MLSLKQVGIKYHFWVFGMTQPGIEPPSLRPLSNTLKSTAYKIDKYKISDTVETEYQVMLNVNNQQFRIVYKKVNAK